MQFREIFGGNRDVAVCREISKVHEQIVRGSIDNAIEHFNAVEPKGEFVIIVGAKTKEDVKIDTN